ncbi:MAG: aconitase X, partial [Thermoplasmata archaeon]
MFLTKEEEKMLNGEMGEAKRKAMEIIVKLGDFFGAENTIDVENVHISGISYKNLGDPGLDFLKKFKNEKVKVKTTLNPIGFDLDFPDFFTNDSNFIKKQIEIINIFHSMGANNTLTCTPYYIENIWEKEHLAWAESSAIVYANSIIGARTNRESGISALASS